MKGFRDLYLLVFLHVDSRRVYISRSTFHPNEEWVKQQAEDFLEDTGSEGLEIKTLMPDRDTKFTRSFDAVFESASVEIKQSAFRSPNTNAFVERFIQTLQQECLDYFVVFGQEHMNHLVSQFKAYYHEERPHQSKENQVLICLETVSDPPDEILSISQVQWSGYLLPAVRDGIENPTSSLRRLYDQSTRGMAEANGSRADQS